MDYTLTKDEQVVKTLSYPVGPQGPIEYPEVKKEAEAWKKM